MKVIPPGKLFFRNAAAFDGAGFLPEFFHDCFADAKRFGFPDGFFGKKVDMADGKLLGRLLVRYLSNIFAQQEVDAQYRPGKRAANPALKAHAPVKNKRKAFDKLIPDASAMADAF